MGKHAASQWKVRVINNFRANKVNSLAWVPSKIEYDNFEEMVEAMRVLKRYVPGKLTMGKSGFKSAFKTLPAHADQAWHCCCIVYNPEVGKHQAAPLLSQSFGSLGAVMAWYRTAMLIQQIMQVLFRVTTFIYVDDCFWVCPESPERGGPDASWQACVFQYVVEDLLGWKLDPTKTEVGTAVTLLGLRINILEEHTEWQLSPDKALEWANQIQQHLINNRLLPAEASKLCGRIGFLNF